MTELKKYSDELQSHSREKQFTLLCIFKPTNERYGGMSFYFCVTSESTLMSLEKQCHLIQVYSRSEFEANLKAANAIFEVTRSFDTEMEIALVEMLITLCSTGNVSPCIQTVLKHSSGISTQFKVFNVDPCGFLYCVVCVFIF